MKVIVWGAGLTGVPTAYYLAKDGHEVTVIERQKLCRDILRIPVAGGDEAASDKGGVRNPWENKPTGRARTV
jgi:glycine/D-amino acid oxidase-like deaminating enzyme